MSTPTENRAYLATISNPRQIHDHPFNTSSAKQLYSFPKAKRFPDQLYRPNCNLAFYDVDAKLFRDNKTTVFKGGNRFDFTRQGENTPGPTAYDVKNNTVGWKGQGVSFGKSREECKDIQALIQRDLNKMPGPGTYTVPDPLRNTRNFSFRIRRKMLDKEELEVGPGQYNIPETINQKTFNFNSRFKNIGTAKIMPMSQTKRKIPKSQSQPAFYDLKTEINPKGLYHSSKFKNSQCRSFGKAGRMFGRAPSAKPGPGAYTAPSDFGLYLSSKANGKENRI